MQKARFFNLNAVANLTMLRLIDAVSHETTIKREDATKMAVKDLQKELLLARNRFNKALISNDY